MFCRIYLSGTSIDSKELLTSLGILLKAGIIDGRYLEKKGYSIEIRSNDDFDAIKEKEYPDGFLYFPFSAEIDFQDKVTEVYASEEVGIILNYLWEKRYTAIASCDFEDLLPEKGGYKSKKIPWFEWGG
jgi:hypothetical protein